MSPREGITEWERREGKWQNGKRAGGEAPVLLWGPLLGEGATAAVPSTPTVNLNVVIDVSVPARKGKGAVSQGPAPAVTYVPSLLMYPFASSQPWALPPEMGSSGMG